MTLQVRDVAGRWNEWDQFVEQNRESSFCHRAKWHDIMSRVLRRECAFLVAEGAEGVWRGVLPLVHVTGLVGKYLVSMPFLDDGGPVGDPEACEALAAEALRLAQSRGVKLLELRSRNVVPGPLASAARKVSVQLEMPATVDELWSKTFKAKLRSQVRRPSKEGMTAIAGAEQLDEFYAVFARNMRDLGTPVLPKAFFAAQLEHFGNSVLIMVVRAANGTPTAASCAFMWHDELYVTWASSLREYNKLSPNMLLYSSMMEHAIQKGLRVFNFGRSTPGAPTHKFKQQWGGRDVPLPWSYWSPDAASSTPTPDKPVFRIATEVWSRLPVALTTRLGPVLARQLP
jgi:serine/alanine adding enzyme